MRFEIKAKINITEGFNIEWRLAAATDGGLLLYAAIPEGERLNITKCVLRPAGLAITTDIVAESAGLFMADVPSKDGELIKYSPIPAFAAGTSSPHGTSLTFWFNIHINKANIFGKLLEIGGEDYLGSLIFAANLSMENGLAQGITGAAYRAKLPEMTLFGVVTLSDFELLYAFNDTGKLFALSGEVTFHLFGNDYGFSGNLAVTDTELEANLSTEAGTVLVIDDKPNMERLFSLTNMKLGVLYRFGTGVGASFFIMGDVTLFGVGVSAKLSIIDGEPVLADAELIKDFSLAYFLRELAGRSILGNTFDIDISKARIYYNASASNVILDNFTYLPGLHAYADIAVKIWFKSFKVSGEIHSDNNSVSACVTIGNIDLFLLRLDSASLFIGKLSGNGQQTQYGVSGTLHLLGICCKNVRLAYSSENGSDIIAGDWVLPEELSGPLGVEKASFQYKMQNKNETVTFSGFEKLKVLDDIKRMADLIEEAINAVKVKDCDSIVKFVSDKIFQAEYVPSLSISAATDTGITFNANLDFILRVANTDTIAFQTKLSCPVHVKSKAFGGLGALAESLAESFAEALTKHLFTEENAESLAKVVGFFAGKSVAEAAASLLCKTLISKAGAKAMTGMMESINIDVAKAGGGGAGGVGAAIGGLAGAGAAATGGESSKWSAIALGVSAGLALFEKLYKRHKKKDPDPKDPDPKNPDDPGGGGSAAVTISPPQNVHASFSGGNLFTVEWKEPDDSNASCYVIEAYSDSSEKLAEAKTCFLINEHEMKIDHNGALGYIRFVVYGKTGLFLSEKEEVRLPALQSAPNVSADLGVDDVTLHVGSVPDATEYTVKIINENNMEMTRTFGGGTLTIPYADPFFAESGVYGSYRLSAWASFGYAPLDGPWSEEKIFAVTPAVRELSPADDVLARFESGTQFMVEWTHSEGADGYDIAVYDDGGNLVSSQSADDVRMCYINVDMTGGTAYLRFTVTAKAGTRRADPAEYILNRPNIPDFSAKYAGDGRFAVLLKNWDDDDMYTAAVKKGDDISVIEEARDGAAYFNLSDFGGAGRLQISVRISAGFAAFQHSSDGVEYDVLLFFAQMLEQYEETARRLPNSNAHCETLVNGDLALWKNVIYPLYTGTGSGRILDGEFFQNKLTNHNYGIGADGQFTKYEYVHFMYRLYRAIGPDFGKNDTSKLILSCVNMLEEYISAFANKGTADKNNKSFSSTDKKLWQNSYHPKLVQSGLIRDGGFFGDIVASPHYGIGTDGKFYGKELFQFLWQACKYCI